MEKKIILSGMRPTGSLHFGNYFGALENWVGLQDSYQCYFFIADWHALTTGYDDTSQMSENIYQILADYIACGLDPDRCVIFLQSLVREHAELHLILSMTTPLSWLERCPTYKEQIANLSEKEIMTYGFLGYPCLMSSDILMYCADYVPVGEDQLPHLELTREIARRFNHIYKCHVLSEPEPLLTKAKVLPGTDGRKMSKSYNNTISFADSPKTVETKVMSMITDPERIHKDDPGHPEICSAYALHKIFSENDIDEIKVSCKKGQIGCVACKKNLAQRVSQFHNPIHWKREKLLADKQTLRNILQVGSVTAGKTAAQTIHKVKEALQFNF
jgi:tryptophanyl-tRNA synthetase